ncbi:MAG: IS3 family transposase [Acidimicrobiales bacterium]
MRVYRFIDEQKADFAIKTLCKVCEVPRSSYYDWAERNATGPDDATWDEAALADQIYECWKASRGAYGAPRMTTELWRAGVVVNHKRVERLMVQLGIQGTHGRRKVRTTRPDPTATPAPDLVHRRFSTASLDELWVGDITYIPTDEGWLYLATVLETCSRRLLGWSMSDHMYTDICTDALSAAALTRDTTHFEGLIFHSDHGCQYTSNEYRKLCRLLGITQSMGTVGDSYDNAMAESFFASFKRELVHDAHFTTKQEARVAIFHWIMWYNRKRLHSSIGYRPPEEFEGLQQRPEAA